MMMEQSKAKRQEIKMLNRKVLEITGIRKVESFDSEEFLLDTELGFLTVRGQHLHMKHLSLEQGLVAIEGAIHTIAYLDGASADKSKGFFGKLFK